MSSESKNNAPALRDEFLERFLPGVSSEIVRLREEISRLNEPRHRELIPQVLLLGESGSGKNHLAQVVSGHRQWLLQRNNRKSPGFDAGLAAFRSGFAHVLLPALPGDLIESELFGYKKGAFTGALKDKEGLLGQDSVSEILLDEVGDASPALQAKLLGVLENRLFRPLGARADEERPVQARLLLATNRPIEQLVADREFREDLYFRLRLLVLRVPSLREQPENIEPIARSIESELREKGPASLRKGQDPELSETDLQWARSYAWPGNVRELKFAIIRWHYYDGERSLASIVDDLREIAPTSASRQNVRGCGIEKLVADALQAARRTGTSASVTLADFAASYEREVHDAARKWCRQQHLSAGELRQLFPQENGTALLNEQGMPSSP
jgi:transcriptional regulator with PAS, ATPase and Fis domain